MVFVRKIYLEDTIPSALDMHTKIRKLLYSITEQVVHRGSEAVPADDKEEADSAQDNDSTHEATEGAIDFDGLDLPVSFGASSRGRKRKRVHKRTRRNNSNPDFLSIDKSEHNLCLCLNDGDGLQYPARIVGVGPSGTPGSHALVTFLGYGSSAEVLRSSHIFPISNDWADQVNQQLEAAGGDTQAYQDMHNKYWDQRYRLFSKFDEGIFIPDEESWFSVTPEIIGIYIAKKLSRIFPPSSVILDCFSGCGGNVIHLGSFFNLVVVSDIDPSKLGALRVNARCYNVSHKIECAVADAFELLSGRQIAANGLNIDVVILAPPWGGMAYAEKGRKFDMHTMFSFGDGFDLVELALRRSKHVVFLVPRNTHKKQFEELAAKFSVHCNVEDFYIHGKCKMTVAYIGPLFKSTGKSTTDNQ